MTATVRTALAVALFLAPAAAFADFYQYETEDGVISFTDDPAGIPARYGDVVERKADRPLADYERLSVAERGASIATAATTIGPGPLVESRAPVAGSAARTKEAAAKTQRVSLQLDDAIVLEVDADGDEPIYVDRRRYITRNGIMSPHTVVSRGDKPLVYINDRPR